MTEKKEGLVCHCTLICRLTCAEDNAYCSCREVAVTRTSPLVLRIRFGTTERAFGVLAGQ